MPAIYDDLPAAVRLALADASPWTSSLPAEEFDAMLAELVDIARATASPDNLVQMTHVLTQWRHTAEIYADPGLYRILSNEPQDDLGPVIPPPHSTE